MFSALFFRISCRVRDKSGKNIVQPDRPQIKILRMRITYWITKATDTHSEYVTHIAFPTQPCVHERAELLRYTYIACVVNSVNTS
jgi:hypothetical protein